MAKGFNWKGIADHGDGTFTTKGKREKSRLLKSLHTSGYKVRSRKTADGSWNISTVGYMRPSRRQTVSRGIRPQVRAARAEGLGGRYRPIRGRHIPLRGRYVRYRGTPGRVPMGGYSGGFGGSFRPRPQGKSMISRFADWQKQRMKDRQDRIKNEQETNEKMKQDRITWEREETAKRVQQMETKRRLQEEETRRAENEAMKRQRHDVFREERARQAEIRKSKYDWTDVQGPKEEKVDSSALQEARENSVT